MRPPAIPFQNIVRLRKSQAVANVYDVNMADPDQLRAYRQVECHIVLYPYSRQIDAQDIAFYPFEEYVKDVLSQQRSAYAAIRSHFNELFGLTLGLIIALAFALFKPQDLLSIESIVSVFGAYTIGKELWDDIERLLVNLSKNWAIRFQDNYYRYRLEKHTTLTAYSYLAKRRRYGRITLMPEQIDFIKQSNSQTLRMCFNMGDLDVAPGHLAHIHSIHIDPDRAKAFEEGGFLFGVKLSFNKRFLGFTKNLEFFQSLDRGSQGCLDENGEWLDGAVFYRRTFTLGRIKYYLSKGIVRDRSIVCFEDASDPPSSVSCI